MTPVVLQRAMNVWKRRKEEQMKEIKISSYLTAIWSRAKTIPPLSKILGLSSEVKHFSKEEKEDMKSLHEELDADSKERDKEKNNA